MNQARRPWHSVLKLRHLIIALTTSSAIITMVATVLASYKVQRQQLIAQSLDDNLAYAAKLANTVDGFFKGALQQLAYSAQIAASDFGQAEVLRSEVRRLHLQTDSFNSVLIVDNDGLIRATSPASSPMQGVALRDQNLLRVIEAGRPYISPPYLPASGNLLVFVSHPVVAADGRQLGAIAGTIYLKHKSVLHQLLGTHYHRDGSYLYVVDAQRRLLYHPDPDRVGTVASANTAVDRLAHAASGSEVLINSRGLEMVAGFASAPTPGWGIVAQRPLAATLKPLGSLMAQVLGLTLPLSLAALVLVWMFALRIAQPLNALAASAAGYRPGGTDRALRAVSSWYFEAAQLKRAMLLGLGVFNGNLERLEKDAATDPLTGLGNRRRFDLSLTLLAEQRAPFSVVVLDIDHFKRINDTHGHDVGDAYLRHLAGLIGDSVGMGDVACRIGGEEFALLLPDTDLAEATARAEALRRRVAEAQPPHEQPMTVSAGVAEWQAGPDEDVQATLKTADQRLYCAKTLGRNQVQAA